MKTKAGRDRHLFIFFKTKNPNNSILCYKKKRRDGKEKKTGAAVPSKGARRRIPKMKFPRSVARSRPAPFYFQKRKKKEGKGRREKGERKGKEGGGDDA